MKRKAFTLIELLVVISIIAILMSIMMPALGKARSIARRVVCATNIKTLAVVSEMYASDHNDKISDPTVAIDGIHIDDNCRNWHLRFLAYTECPKIYECPAFKSRLLDESGSVKLTEFTPSTGQYAGQTFRLNYTGAVYAFAGYDHDRFGGPKYDADKGGREWKLNQIKSFAAKDDWRGILFGDGIYRINTDDWAPHERAIIVRGESAGSTSGRGYFLHDGQANFMVADGSVGYQDEEYVWKEAYEGTDTSYSRYNPGLLPSMLK